uniref:Uncharacterized protein n=2 Tax=Rousettus aegyptiacus TaxID=9407 RepID=A0A7J8EKY5_ROUAE|nr:hypothetical protein HJG63_012920 [Rousettus aegyptiacus]
MSQFQAVQEQVNSKCRRTKASLPSSQHMMPPRAGLLQNDLSPGMFSPSEQQSHEDMILKSPGKEQGMLSYSPRLPIPSSPGQNPLGSFGFVCQHTQMPKATPSGMPLTGFYSSSLGSQPLSPYQLRQPCVPRMHPMFNDNTWAAAAAAATPVVSRERAQSQVDNSFQQHFDGNLIFAKAPVRVPLVAPACPSQQAVMPPSLGVPGVRPGQTPVQVPVPILDATKSFQQGIVSFGPMSPIQGIEPPLSYVAAAAAAATTSTASAIAISQSPGPSNAMGLPSKLLTHDFLLQPSLNDPIVAPDYDEVDFTDAVMKDPGASPNEAWTCNLRLIDDILEQQHAAAQNATARNAGQVTQNSQNIFPPNTP